MEKLIDGFMQFFSLASRVEVGHSINLTHNPFVFNVQINLWLYLIALIIFVWSWANEIKFIDSMKRSILFLVGSWLGLSINTWINLFYVFNPALANFFILPLFIGIITLMGALSVSIIARDRVISWAEFIGLSWGIGVGINLFVFYLSWLGMIMNIVFIFLTYFLIIMALYFIKIRTTGFIVIISERFSWPKTILATLFFGYVIFSAITNNVIFSDERFYFDLANQAHSTGIIAVASVNDTHPLLVPAMIASTMLVIVGNVGVGLVKLPIALTYIALILLFFSNLKKYINGRSAWLFTALLSGLPLLLYHSRWIYCDLTMAYYCFAGTIYAFNYLKSKRFSDLVFSAIFLGLGIHVKSSGLPLALITATMLPIFLLLEKGNKQ